MHLDATTSFVVQSWAAFVGLLPWALLTVLLGFLGVRIAQTVHAMRFPRLEDGSPPLDHPLIHRWFDRLATTAAHAPVPETLTWSPRVALSTTNTDLGGAAPALARRNVTLSQLMDGRQVLSYGVDLETGEPHTADGEVTSAGIVGRPGSGKSTTAAWLALQVERSLGGKVHVGDPHASKGRSLTAKLIPIGIRTVWDPQQILARAQEVHSELNRRKAAQGTGKTAADWPLWVLLIDEWTALMRGRVGELLAPLLADIVSEGQGYGVVCWLLAQDWRLNAVGEGVRNQMNTTIIHKCRPEDARMASGLRADSLPGDVMELEPGICYVSSPEGLAKVQVPDLNAEALASVGVLPPARPGTVRPTVQRPAGVVDGGTGRTMDADPDLARKVLDSFREARGDTVKVIENVYGLRPGGRLYQTARLEVGRIVHAALYQDAEPAPAGLDED